MNKKILPLFEENEQPIYNKFLPICSNISKNNYDVNEWDIPYTIKELSYLVHSHYRYYGKFPPAVVGQILEQFPPPTSNHYVLDNFCGSGTTLVEAKLRGIDSYGTDISWLSVLASNMKVRNVDIEDIERNLKCLINNFQELENNSNVVEDAFTLKWFDPVATKDLTVIQGYIYNLKKGNTRNFLLLAFIGIVRRISKAHNGEVRPHINKSKKQRGVLEAFSKKIFDMCKDHSAFMDITSENTKAHCFHSDNLFLPKQLNDKKCYLVISHPPYLNSFNYAPVYSLEFYWGKIFEAEYAISEKMHKTELKAHPATEKITAGYFEHLKEGYTATYNIQERGSYLAIVIGDCTRNGKLIPVLDTLIKIVEEIGYTTIEVNYRTTHYGLGKYAYKHRADYHGDAEKKEGILIFRK